MVAPKPITLEVSESNPSAYEPQPFVVVGEIPVDVEAVAEEVLENIDIADIPVDIEGLEATNLADALVEILGLIPEEG